LRKRAGGLTADLEICAHRWPDGFFNATCLADLSRRNLMKADESG